ncbi:MAG: cache domain-containing protein, partial [Sphaerochaetaceae bacterium]|nr:cache domain-containing protein [Sphaerochaetaceae bacterium]
MKPKRLFILFIIGLLSTIAILALTFSLFFEKTTERQLKAYGQMALESDVLFVNTIVESTKDLLDSISMDADISRLLNYETLSASNLLTGLRRLDKYTSSSYIIDSIYIYNRRNQTVYVSSPHLPEAVYSIEDFPDFDASNILKKYSGIKNMEPIFRSFNAFYPVISEVSYLSFIRFNTLEKENDSNVIMVNIRQTMLTSLNRNSLGSNNGALIIANTDGEYKILSEENNKFNDSTIKNLLSKAKENSNDFTFEINNRSFIVCTEKIINDSALLILVADEDIMAYETRTKGYGGSIILLGILLGICTILSALLFRRIWKNNVSQLESIEKHKIQNQIMMEESKRARLLSFLNSDIALDDKDLSNQKPEQAILLLIIIDHYNKEADKNNLKEVLCKRLCALLSQNSPLFYTYENDERCALVLSSLDADKLLEIKELIQTELNITLSIFVGNECTIESLPETYELLCKFLSYRVLFGPNQIITVPMLEEREMTQYSIPQPIIKKLTEEILKLNVPE